MTGTQVEKCSCSPGRSLSRGLYHRMHFDTLESHLVKSAMLNVISVVGKKDGIYLIKRNIDYFDHIFRKLGSKPQTYST